MALYDEASYNPNASRPVRGSITKPQATNGTTTGSTVTGSTGLLPITASPVQTGTALPASDPAVQLILSKAEQAAASTAQIADSVAREMAPQPRSFFNDAAAFGGDDDEDEEEEDDNRSRFWRDANDLDDGDEEDETAADAPVVDRFSRANAELEEERAALEARIAEVRSLNGISRFTTLGSRLSTLERRVANADQADLIAIAADVDAIEREAGGGDQDGREKPFDPYKQAGPDVPRGPSDGSQATGMWPGSDMIGAIGPAGNGPVYFRWTPGQEAAVPRTTSSTASATPTFSWAEGGGVAPYGVYSNSDLELTYHFGGPSVTYGEQATAQREPFKNIIIHDPGGDLSTQEYIDRSHRLDPRPGGTAYYGYHFYIAPDGSITQAAPMTARTNGALGYGEMRNNNSIHIVMVGTENTPDQVMATSESIEALQADYEISPERIAGHGNLQPDREERTNLAIWQVLENVGALEGDVLRPGDGMAPFEPDPRVSEVQSAINLWAATSGRGAIADDGIFGGGTLDAVLAFQAAHGLDLTGFIDAATRQALFEYEFE